MKIVRYKDEEGFLHQSFIREDMMASEAHLGVQHDPPDVRRLDWVDIQRKINNLLLERNLITLKDIAGNTNARGILENTVKSVIVPELIKLYKENPGYEPSPNGKPDTKDIKENK